MLFEDIKCKTKQNILLFLSSCTSNSNEIKPTFTLYYYYLLSYLILLLFLFIALIYTD